MCTEGVKHWTALHRRALTHTSWGCSSYIPGHELKAVAARHIHPFFRKAMEAVLSCFKMHHSKPVKSTHFKMVLVWDGVKEHMLVREDEMSEYHTGRYTSVTCSCPSWANDSGPDFTWPPESTSLRDFMVLTPFISESNLVQCKWISKR